MWGGDTRVQRGHADQFPDSSAGSVGTARCARSRGSGESGARSRVLNSGAGCMFLAPSCPFETTRRWTRLRLLRT